MVFYSDVSKNSGGMKLSTFTQVLYLYTSISLNLTPLVTSYFTKISIQNIQILYKI